MAKNEKAAKRNLAIGCVLLGLFVVVGVAFRFLVYPLMQGDLVASTGSESKYTHELVLRLDSFSGYAPLRAPALHDDLRRQGVKLTVEDDGADVVARMKALKKGQAQMAVFTVDAFVSAGADVGFPGTIVGVLDETVGADAIVSYREAVPSLAALDHPDAKMVLTEASPSEFLARVAIAEFGMNKLSRKWVGEDGAEAVFKAMKKSKQSQRRAYVLWEPYKTQALEDPRVHVLFDSSRITGYVVDVLVAERTFLRDHPDVVQHVLESTLRTIHAAEQQPGGMVAMVQADAKAQGEKLSDKQASAVVQGIRWRNTLENYTQFGLVEGAEAAGILHMEDAIANIADVLVRTEGLAQDPTEGRAHELFYTGILDTMRQSNFHPGAGLGIVSGGASGELEAVRPTAVLPALAEAEWAALTPAGSMYVPPISFGRGGAKLNIQSERELDALARRLKSLPHFYVTVSGHARNEGDADANLQLAADRARAARAHLLSRGIADPRIRARGVPPSATSGDAQAVSFELAQQPY